MTAAVALPLRIGARTLGKLKRRLVRVPVTLDQGLSGEAPPLPPLATEADGYLVTGLPAGRLADVRAGAPGLRAFVRQRYPRSYASLDTSFEDYLAGFSAKSRSTLKRKVRRFAEADGGKLDLRACHRPSDVAEFHRHARAVSARTYQEQKLGTGLPEDSMVEMQALAAQDAMRAWLLFLRGEPVSYLYAPAEGATLIYAHLGYDPAHAALSPGTVLKLEAMRELMGEGRFARFDFTEGDGQHKRLFGTGAVDCVDLLLLRRTSANLLTGLVLNGFDGGVAVAKATLRRLGLQSLARLVRR